LTRRVSDAIGRCELTHLDRQSIDLSRARAQHCEYERALERLGCRIEPLVDASDLPDAVFIEDAAIVVDELAVVTRPGASSRRPEIAAVASALDRYRVVRRIEAPGTVDGGDVLVIGKSVFVGRSSRTNDDGIHQLRNILSPFGYDVCAVQVDGCLHLKSAATSLSVDKLLVNPSWVSLDAFARFDFVEIDPVEPLAANIVRVGEGFVYPAAFPRTLERLERGGFRVVTVDVSELAKAEGAVTCCSIIFRDYSGTPR